MEPPLTPDGAIAHVYFGSLVFFKLHVLADILRPTSATFQLPRTTIVKTNNIHKQNDRTSCMLSKRTYSRHGSASACPQTIELHPPCTRKVFYSAPWKPLYTRKACQLTTKCLSTLMHYQLKTTGRLTSYANKSVSIDLQPHPHFD
jgi:hypothetical protein